MKLLPLFSSPPTLGLIAPKNSMCQLVRKFWHFFDGIYYIIWHLETSEKKTLYNNDWKPWKNTKLTFDVSWRINIWHIARWVSSSDHHSMSSVLAPETKIAIKRNCVWNERRCLTNVPYLSINLRGRGDPEPQVGLLPKKGQIFWDRDRWKLMRIAAPSPAWQQQEQG